MHIVILGGSGFIGRRLAAKLVAGGHAVTVGDLLSCDLPGVAWKACDVTDRSALQTVLPGADAVYNLAAEHHDDVRPRSRYHAVNVHGAELLCQAADGCGVTRIIFTSSVAIYGTAPGPTGGAPAENDPPHPDNEYGRTKWEAETVYRRWRAQGGSRRLTVVRPTTVFGEGNRGNIYSLLRAIERGRFAMIGSGRNVKSLAYVDNVAAFLQYVLADSADEITYNYADKPDLSMNDLVCTVRAGLQRPARVGLRLPYAVGYLVGALFDGLSAVTGRPFSISRQRMRKFVSTTQFAADKALAGGFTPEFTLIEGLHRTLAYEFPTGSQPH